MSLQFLQPLGLTDTEIKLYELLLKLGETSAREIVKISGIKRPTVYKAFYSLEKKGLVIQRELLKKIHFSPISPSFLLQKADEQYQTLDRMRKNLQTVMPQLSSEYISSVQKPLVEVYEGVEGLKNIYLDILKDAKPGLSILQGYDMDDELATWVVDFFTKKRVQKKMPLKVLIANDKSAKEFMKNDVKALRFSRAVPPETFPFQHEVTIYGDKVAFMHYKKGDVLIGMVIKHPHFAQTMKAVFDLAWVGAEKYT